MTPKSPVTPVAMGKATRGVELAAVKDLDERQVAAWMKQAVLSGALVAPGFAHGGPARRRHYLQVKWIPQGWQWVDPEKEYKAMLLAGIDYLIAAILIALLLSPARYAVSKYWVYR